MDDVIYIFFSILGTKTQKNNTQYIFLRKFLICILFMYV